jgi:tetratricopeptide (TPR) repeat protein
VLDREATIAAAALYEALSRSQSIAEAVASTYQKLIEQEARDWHLLRLYAAQTLPGSLITPRNTPGWKAAAKPSIAPAFLDPLTKKIKVATREEFVGRRRPLQNCLRELTQNPETIAVLIHGMGGLGKSTVATRLCDRLPRFKRLVWQGRLDPQSLVRELAKEIDDRALRQRLLDPEEDLSARLRWVFEALAEQGKPSFLLVFDDFEANLDAQGTGYVMKPPAVTVMNSLIEAIQQTDTGHRLILTSRYDFEMTHSQVMYRQPLDAMQGADLQKKCDRLPALKPPIAKSDAAAAIQEAEEKRELQEQAKRLADGNPRLLELLHDRVLIQAQIDRAAQLQQFSDDPTELRQKVLEPRVLAQMQDGLAKMLSCGLVFELPVPRSAFAEVTAGADLIDRAVALGLLEVSPDETLRVPRILPLNLPEEVQSLSAAAAETLYRDWWQSEQGKTELQGLEIHRLALLAGAAEIAAVLGSDLGHGWYNQSRFREAVALSEKTIAIAPDYRVFHSLARSQEVLGNVQAALENYQQARDTCPETDQQQKAAILHNLAIIYAQQGQVQQAIDLYQQSLDAEEAIGDVQGKAATLHNLAGIYAQQGQVQQAIDLYQQSLDAEEAIGDVQGKAATLANLAFLAGEAGDRERQIELNLQAALALAQAGAYIDLLTVLGNLSVADEARSQIYLAQALWLGLRIQPALTDMIHLLRFFYDRVPQGDALEALLATTAVFVCQTRGENHPQLEELQKLSVNLLAGAAAAQGVELNSLDDLWAWMAQQQLNDPQVLIPQLVQRLESIVGEEWLFDRSKVR